MAAIIGDVPLRRRSFCLAHAIALDLADILVAEEQSWWDRLLGRNDQRLAIRCLIEGVVEQTTGRHPFSPKTLGEIWQSVQGPIFDELRGETDEFDFLEIAK